jgi:hypothetical protein
MTIKDHMTRKVRNQMWIFMGGMEPNIRKQKYKLSIYHWPFLLPLKAIPSNADPTFH